MGKETCRLLTPLGLKANAQETPLAVEGAVEFQWRLASVSPGAYQSAYRVVLRAESRELLWDSGKVLSARQLQIPYEGRALEPFARYFWRVMVWDVEGNASPWSEEAAFETGPLSAEDWRCGWIACGQRDDPLAGAKWMGVESMPGEAVDFPLISLRRRTFSRRYSMVRPSLAGSCTVTVSSAGT